MNILRSLSSTTLQSIGKQTHTHIAFKREGLPQCSGSTGRQRLRGSSEWMTEKAAWRRWHLSLGLEDGKVLMLGLLIFLSLLGSEPVVWLDSSLTI